MTKAELIAKVCDVLREMDARKPVSIPKQQFTITDDSGNSRSFHVKRRDKEVLYTVDDIRQILDAAIDVVLDTVKHGESISIKKLGTLHIHFREARKTRIPGTRQWTDIPAHYVPKLEYSSALREAARIYEAYKIEAGDPLFENKPKRGRGRPRKNREAIDELIADFAKQSADASDDTLDECDSEFDIEEEYDEADYDDCVDAEEGV